MAVNTPTDRPKSALNSCVVEVFGGVFVLSSCFLDFSLDVGVFGHMTESDLFPFPLYLLITFDDFFDSECSVTTYLFELKCSSNTLSLLSAV